MTCPGRSVQWIPTPFGVKFVMAQLHPKCKECARYVPGSSELMPAMRMGECPNLLMRHSSHSIQPLDSSQPA
jgi:hypothetical protein